MLKLYSWNVNGLRAVAKHGFADWLTSAAPDILCLQETRVQPHQLDLTLRHPQGYHSYWSPAAQAGYSGVGIYTRQEPHRIQVGMGMERFDIEGRTLIAEFADFFLVNTYIPSGAEGRSKWFYKMAFLYQLLDDITLMQAEGKSIILCGDFNIAHQPIDVVRPIRVAGFTAEERDWVSELLEKGFLDAYRHLHPHQEGAYTWWSQREGLRDANRGWRIDYIFISADLAGRLDDAQIHPQVRGSDHCPVSITLTEA
jgi:exodeoxyribonuclease-3